MNKIEVKEQIDNIWSVADPSRRRETLKVFKKVVPPELRGFFDAYVDSKLFGIEDRQDATVLVLLHGMQTDGAWQQLVKRDLKSISWLNVVPLGYDCVAPWQLVGPFREGPINSILGQVMAIREREPKARLMLIAHSFGSYIASIILKTKPDIVFERIIFCGSIIPRNFDWETHAKNMKPGSIVNDVGTRDLWPIVATCTSFGYGASGFLGFQKSFVVDRYFKYAHSTYFEPKRQHIKKYWLPFIQHGEIIPSGWGAKKPPKNFFLLWMTHPWIGRPVVAALLVWGLWKFFVN